MPAEDAADVRSVPAISALSVLCLAAQEQCLRVLVPHHYGHFRPHELVRRKFHVPDQRVRPAARGHCDGCGESLVHTEAQTIFTQHKFSKHVFHHDKFVCLSSFQTAV
uniref:(northern house mosquito) hypothetical protein n=1 Tax=Culex pipiens TaxID=7175 RepID=A0A8D8MDR6_CULPI